MTLSFEKWAHALAIVESENTLNPPLGDDGQAAFRWQMHPSFFAQWYRPAVGSADTWDAACHAALYSFWMTAQKLLCGDVQAAVGFHLHGQPAASVLDMQSADGQQYAARFRAAITKT